VQRVRVERDTLDAEENRATEAIRTLTARIVQLGNDITREGALNADAGDSIARLDDERAGLNRLGEGHHDTLAAALTAAHAAAEILSDCETVLSELTEEAARLAARHQSAERRVQDARKSDERNTRDAETAHAAALQAADRLKTLERDHDAAQATMTAATDLAQRAEDALIQTETVRADAQNREGDARAARAAAEGQATTLDAEVRALTRLLERERGEGDQLLDHVRVAPGYENAVGAALSDDLKAAMAAASGGTGWTELLPYDTAHPLPAGAAQMDGYADAPPVLSRRLSQVGVVEAADGPRLQPLLQPGQRLVSRAGDLWRWDGYALAAADGVSTAARRLQQANRLDELSAEMVRASQAADSARAAHAQVAARLGDLTEADKAARAARRDADARLAEASRALSRVEADRNILAGKLETLHSTAKRHEDEAASARRELTLAEGAWADLEDLAAMRARVTDKKTTVEAARMTMLARRTAHDELKRDGEARDRRNAAIAGEITGWQKRLETATARITELDTRKTQTEAELAEAAVKPAELAAKRDTLFQTIRSAEVRLATAADALSVAEASLRTAVAAERDAERAASDAREARARAEARRDAASEGVVAASERITSDMEATPQTLLETLNVDPEKMPGAEAIEADVIRLRRQRDALGAVNLRAEEDAQEIAEEHDTLKAEKLDLEEAIKTLRSGIGSLNREGRERLLTAFDEVNTNFAKLFTHLFGGGEARLVLVESDDPLEAGLEILCQPPGKKLSTLSLLSGGEQTLTALALIFAVFLANPAPICVLDEVDAPLDDANVTRFCDLLDEMTRQTDTRFLIITHHAVTMSRMDRLFGVTMAEQGVSQLVSVDLKKAEQLVA